MKYEIRTPYGNYYTLNEKGQVMEYSNGFKSSGSDSWKVLGLVELKPFGRIGKLIPLSEAVKITCFTFKNGNPKYTAIDLDHGTRRMWGNVRCHGVARLWVS